MDRFADQDCGSSTPIRDSAQFDTVCSPTAERCLSLSCGHPLARSISLAHTRTQHVSATKTQHMSTANMHSKFPKSVGSTTTKQVTLIHAQQQTQPHTHTHACTHTCKFTQALTHSLTHTQTQTCTLSHTHTLTLTHSHTHTHTHTFQRACKAHVVPCKSTFSPAVPTEQSQVADRRAAATTRRHALHTATPSNKLQRALHHTTPHCVTLCQDTARCCHHPLPLASPRRG